MKKIFLSLLLILSFYATTSAEEMIACTMEAKLCSDGVTYVGRTGPNCEFEACPAEKPKVCTKEYIPVCGQPAYSCPSGMMCNMMIPLPKTYGNTCMMEADGATFISTGVCANSQLPKSLLTDTMKQKIDTKIQVITEKIDANYSDSIKKSLLIYKLIGKLNDMKPKSAKLQEAIQYIIQKLEEYNRSFQDQSSWNLPD